MNRRELGRLQGDRSTIGDAEGDGGRGKRRGALPIFDPARLHNLIRAKILGATSDLKVPASFGNWDPDPFPVAPAGNNPSTKGAEKTGPVNEQIQYATGESSR